MVKGVSKQVIVVKSPDGRMFDQAIFILREDALGEDGVDEETIIEQANRAASGYLQSAVTGGRGSHWRLPRPCWAAAGGGLVGLAWLLSILL
jgi:hypothetical protein